MAQEREECLLITGSNGRIGRLLCQRLSRPGRKLRLLDVDYDQASVPAGAEFLHGSVTDRDIVSRAVAGVDGIVHLAGIAAEAPWEKILDNNVHGTWAILEAASSAGVPKVILASSNHAVGFLPGPSHGAAAEKNSESDPSNQGAFVKPLEGLLPCVDTFAPDSYYGWSKTAMESLGRLFVAKTGLDVVAVRIGSCWAEPRNLRALGIWLSPDDMTRLVDAAMQPEVKGYHCIWGVSNNTRRWWSLAEGEAIGFHPLDDAETFAHKFESDHTSNTKSTGDFVGGVFPSWKLGVHG